MESSNTLGMCVYVSYIIKDQFGKPIFFSDSKDYDLLRWSWCWSSHLAKRTIWRDELINYALKHGDVTYAILKTNHEA